MTLPRKILVPTDFGDDAGAALTYAIELAATLGAMVHVVHFYALPSTVLADGSALAKSEETRVEAATLKKLADLAQSHGLPSVEITLGARRGDARDGIGEAAEEIGADLVCMGTHGRRGLSHLLLGSVAEHTVRVSKVPTLTLRAAP